MVNYFLKMAISGLDLESNPESISRSIFPAVDCKRVKMHGTLQFWLYTFLF